MGEFDDKVVLVTGAAGGIGSAVARTLARAGTRLALIDSDESGLATLVSDLEAGGVPAKDLYSQPADVSREAEVAAYVEAASSRLGEISVLCNLAAILGRLDPLKDASVDEFERILAINTIGTWLNIKHVSAAMIEAGKGGSIVNASANLVTGSIARFGAYVASQHAIVGLTKTAALELAEDRIRVNAALIGPTEAPMSQAARDQLSEERGTPPPLPLGRRAEAQEIADAFLFLASERSSFVTGASIPVDGGYTA